VINKETQEAGKGKKTALQKFREYCEKAKRFSNVWNFGFCCISFILTNSTGITVRYCAICKNILAITRKRKGIL
jgi:hypothetical protein